MEEEGREGDISLLDSQMSGIERRNMLFFLLQTEIGRSISVSCLCDSRVSYR